MAMQSTSFKVSMVIVVTPSLTIWLEQNPHAFQITPIFFSYKNNFYKNIETEILRIF